MPSLKSKKKIGLILHQPIAYSETFLHQELNIWKKLGFDVKVFSKFPSKPYQPSNYSLKTGLSPPFSISTLAKLLVLFMDSPVRAVKFIFKQYHISNSWKLALKNYFFCAHIIPNHIDVVIFGFADTMIGKESLGQILNAETILCMRGQDIGIESIKYPILFKRAYPFVDRIMSRSVDLLATAHAQGLSKETPYFIIPGFVEINKNTLPVTINCKDQPLNIISIGRLHWKKDHYTTLEALNLLKQQNLKFKCTIVGGGVLMEELKTLAHSLKINEHIDFRGPLSHNEVLELYPKHNLFISSSLQEGCSNALLEAMANGCFPIVTHIPGHWPLKENMGFKFKPRCSKSLYEQIQSCQKLSQNQIQTMLKYGRMEVEQHFSLEVAHDNWCKLFNA